MRIAGKYCSIGMIGAVAIAWVAAALSPALASLPVPRTLTGCVVDGKFVTSDGYIIAPRCANGRALDLRSLEGRKVTIRGDLLPGDRFIVKSRLRELGRCETR